MEATGGTTEAATTVKGLLAIYNERAEKAGARPIKAWKGSKADLEKRLEALGKVERKAETKPKPEAKAKSKAAKKEPKEKKEAKPRGRGIGAFVKVELAKGRNTEQVLDAVKKHFPGASTTANCIRWYACKFRKEA